MTGTFINIGAIIAGGFFGILLGNHLPNRLKHTIIAGLGLFTLALGFQMFLKTENAIIPLGGLVIGALIGELLLIEDRLQNLGRIFEKRFLKQRDQPSTTGSSNFIRGFLTTSLLFCIGPIAILGSIQDGLTGNHQLLLVKSILDGFSALAFASTLGIGVLFSSVIVLVYQGSLSILAAQFQSITSTSMINELTAVGGLILIGIAISNLLEIKKVRTGNFLPALIISPLIVALMAAIQ
jgi:uncharacterized membrane protein YqgA involved in biofilm formation